MIITCVPNIFRHEACPTTRRVAIFSNRTEHELTNEVLQNYNLMLLLLDYVQQ